MLTRFVMAAILLSVAGCLNSTVVSDACTVFQPIHGDPVMDTPETMRQIDNHNDVGVRLCGW
jgi:hypothetical protein